MIDKTFNFVQVAESSGFSMPNRFITYITSLNFITVIFSKHIIWDCNTYSLGSKISCLCRINSTYNLIGTLSK